MKTYQGSEIRNVAVVGHAHSGKTTLIAALLHAAKMTPTQGRVEDGTAVTAYDEEEVARGATMQNAVAFAEWQGVKVNLIDTPGFHMFTHEARAALFPVEAAIVVVNAQNGIEPVTERVWRYADEANVPRIVLVNQMDHPKAGGGGGLSALIDDLVDRWGRNCVPVQLPISDAEGFHGVVDLVTMEAYNYTPGGDGRGKVTAEIPATLAADAKARHEALVELVAEGKDELMEEYFEKGTIPEEHLIAALHEAIREDRIFPVLFSSGLANMALDHLLDFIKVYTPSPVERGPSPFAFPPSTPQPPKAKPLPWPTAKSPTANRSAMMVFKTMTDPFAGRISFFKVISGVVKNDATLENYTRRDQERLSHLSIMQGRKAVEVPELHAGDLGAVAKLRVTLTGDTLGAKGSEIQIDLHPIPEPAMTYAIEPKSRADEDKLAPAIHKLMEEDLLIRFFRDPQTNEFLIAGAGQPHIEAIVSRLKKRYHAEVTLKSPKVPYRETIRAKAEAQGRHKKQSGGHGQFGDCKIRMEPMPRGAGFEFANEVFGGAIPRNFIPAIEKGIVESAARGYLAGYPVVDFKAIVYRRQLSRRRLQRNVLQDGRPPRLPQGDGDSQALPARTHHESRNRGSRRVRRSPDGRPQQPSRPRPGHGLQGPHNAHQRPGSHGRNAHLRNPAHFHDARQGQLPHGDGPLRHRPAVSGRKNPGQRQTPRRRRGRVGTCGAASRSLSARSRFVVPQVSKHRDLGYPAGEEILGV